MRHLIAYSSPATFPNSATNYSAFDALGPVTASSQVTGGQAYGFSYAYNLEGSLTSETYPSGRVVTTGYNAANQMNTLSGSLAGQGSTYVSWATYWPQGAEWGLAYGNNVIPVYVYNNRLQTSQIYTTTLNRLTGVTDTGYSRTFAMTLTGTAG